jgi:alpha-mannosidase
VKISLFAETVVETDLLEQPVGDIVKIQNGVFSSVFKPYEIKTFKVK